MAPKPKSSWRAPVFCAPLWCTPGALLEALDPSAGRQREKLLSACTRASARYRTCCDVAGWDWPETWSPWSFHMGEEEEEGGDIVYLRFENQTESAVSVYWFSNGGEEQMFYKLNPKCSITQETFSGNVWMIREDTEHRRLLKRVKVDAREVRRQVCYIKPVPEGKTTDPTVDHFPSPDVRIPTCYTRILETDLGIPVVADSDVCMASLHAAADIIKHMLEGCQAYVLKELRRHQCKVAVIGRNKVTTDILEHSHLRGSPTPDGRDWDTEVRGLGGTLVIPTCSVGEENLLRCAKDRFGQESILVHEFAHTVMEVALSKKNQQRIKHCFLKNKHRYKAGIYMVADEKEYWAEGTESWFNASLRADVNDGVNTREKLWAHDPELACLLREVFGNTSWRYDFSPVPEE